MSGESEYFKLRQSDVKIIDTIDKIDVQTTYQANDYVLRRYPSTKIGTGNPHKYGSWCGVALIKSQRSTTVPEATW